MKRRKSIAGALSVACSLAIAALWLCRAPVAAAFDNQHWGSNYFPNVELTTQDGKKVKLYDDLIRNKIVVVDLIYTHCVDACPLETARLAQVQKLLGDSMGKDIFFYSITIDPKRDTPEALKAYADKYHAGPGWLFLTGKKDDIELVSKKLGLYSEPDPNDRDGHTPSVVVGNERTGQWMRNSATDNPRFLAMLIGDWLNNWKYSASGNTKQQTYENARPIKLEAGQYIFSTHCAACHTVGHGDKIGPDLMGVTSARERKWLLRFIQEPDKVLDEKDPTAIALFRRYKEVRMPNLRVHTVDAEQILNYIARQSAKATDDKQSRSAVAASRNTSGQGATGGLSRSISANK